MGALRIFLPLFFLPLLLLLAHFFLAALVVTMSAARGSLARLPLGIFEDLLVVAHHEDEEENVPELSALELRASICEKLKNFRRKLRNGSTSIDSIKTVGSLLQLSIPTLLHALDPLFTYGKPRY